MQNTVDKYTLVCLFATHGTNLIPISRRTAVDGDAPVAGDGDAPQPAVGKGSRKLTDWRRQRAAAGSSIKDGGAQPKPGRKLSSVVLATGSERGSASSCALRPRPGRLPSFAVEAAVVGLLAARIRMNSAAMNTNWSSVLDVLMCVVRD
jgi:hypothetical protein